MAALGRPFTLGMLYNSRRDELIPGVSLWDEQTLQANTVESRQHSSGFEVTASDSIESKSSLLDINASLKASFLSGLIEIEGSAKYLNDKKKFKNQSRVTLQYKVTTIFKQLFMTNIESMSPQQIDVIEKSSATHVVTGILYGANAFFVFDSEKLDGSSVQDIQSSMYAVIKKIPSFNDDGRADIKLTDEEKAMTDKFTCKFYGDFILDCNPATFTDAVKTYVQLPKLLGEKYENVVPLKVWMMPLKKLHFKAPTMITGISVRLLRKIQDALQELHHLEACCNDILDDAVVNAFPNIQEKWSTFQKFCMYFRSALEQTIAEKLPSIRAQEIGEWELQKVFIERDKTPFSHEKLIKWTEDMGREVNVIRSLVKMMEGTKIISNQSELDRVVLDPGVEDVLCFVFTSLEPADPHLQEMSVYLNSVKLQGAGGVLLPAHEQWFSSDEVIKEMRPKARVIHDLAKALKNNRQLCFLVAAFANEKHKGASIYHYRSFSLVTDDFSKPDVTDVKNVKDRRDLIWYACDLTLDPDTAHCNLTLSNGNKRATHGESQSCTDLPQRFDRVVQVLCREPLTGRCYWEVELNMVRGADAAAAVCYSSLQRKGTCSQVGLGWNNMAWSVGHKWMPGPTFYAEHPGSSADYPDPPSGCTRLGLYLDWRAGTLSYYIVSGDTLSHIHTFRTEFSEPVYAAFKLWTEGSCIFLCL
ncbi:stonustoxin subunit beta-like [Stegastes partitus]|uniref:Stonustoxin subunit beta-like n=1 Tax=Stegastes partitus TaxID=144197 RepID=A0A3B5AHN4_9TELE|nr:PREDICTED: stonustoxin subunit beta-like [Stegastes partitus]XP_008290594.1 PREDICTED: stonustoxin subunit beta-like [Stegastes partitus]